MTSLDLVTDALTMQRQVDQIYNNYKKNAETIKVKQLKSDLKLVRDVNKNFEQCRLDLGQDTSNLNSTKNNKTIGDRIYFDGVGIGIDLKIKLIFCSRLFAQKIFQQI